MELYKITPEGEAWLKSFEEQLSDGEVKVIILSAGQCKVLYTVLSERSAKANKPLRAKREVFTVPSVDEVESYCNERDNGINPQAFVDFYETRGWKVGKEKMKDWKAAIRTWENNKKEREQAQKPSSERYTTAKKDFRSGGIYESM